jgi:hypothetical protein
MESVAEQRETNMRAAATVLACDIEAGGARATTSLVAECSRHFGKKATDLFDLELQSASKFSVSVPEEHADGVRTVTVTYVEAPDKKRVLTLAPGDHQLWKCSCCTMSSRLVPCRHLARYLQGVNGVTFKTYAPYFHERWAINTTLPPRTMRKISRNSAVVKELVAAENARRRDLEDATVDDVDKADTPEGDPDLDQGRDRDPESRHDDDGDDDAAYADADLGTIDSQSK